MWTDRTVRHSYFCRIMEIEATIVTHNRKPCNFLHRAYTHTNRTTGCTHTHTGTVKNINKINCDKKKKPKQRIFIQIENLKLHSIITAFRNSTFNFKILITELALWFHYGSFAVMAAMHCLQYLGISYQE